MTDLGVFLVIKQFKPVGIPFRQDTFQCEIVMQDNSPLKVLMLIPDEFVAKVNDVPVAITMEGMQYIYEQGNKYFPNPEITPDDFKPATEVEDDFFGTTTKPEIAAKLTKVVDDFDFDETPAPATSSEWDEEDEDATTSDDKQWDEQW